jgi:predicted O-linked N-acetylglucosamine transferase (SPINDLY family)
MSNDLVLEQSLAQMRQGDAVGALERLRRLAQMPGGTAGPPEVADQERRLNLACAQCCAGDHDAVHLVLQAFEAEFPDWDEPSFRLGESHRMLGDVEAAELAYGRCVEKNPTRPEALLALGTLLLDRCAPEPAGKLLKLCCALAPERHEAWNGLGRCLMLMGNAGPARGAFVKAQRLAPMNVEYVLNRVEAAVAMARLDDELNWLEIESEADPCNAALLTARGEAMTRCGQNDLAIDLFEAATILAPREKLPFAKLGQRLTETMRPHEAECALKQALALDPDNGTLGLWLSVALLRQSRHRECVVVLEDLIGRIGENAALLGNLATANVALGRQTEAIAQTRRAIALQPDNPKVWRALCNNLPYYEAVTAAELSEAAREAGRLWPREIPPVLSNWRDPDRRLRVGLVSGTLKVHPVGWLTIAGLEALDAAEFELVRLTQTGYADHIAQRFAAIAPERHDTSAFDDAGLARHIRSIGIDILLDLGGYGDLGRLPAFAYRAAPVQVKWVGMQYHTTGLAEIDWIIADRWEIPAELERYYTERPMRMPDGYLCYSPPPDAPPVGPLPALANGYVTFGCFNNIAKLTPVVVESWARLLRQMPTARLWLKAPQFDETATLDAFRVAFASHGIGAERLTFTGRSHHRPLLAEYNNIDIVLDPFPYSGGLTTCEALWMGVPTVSFPGETFASRHSLSHLSNVGLSDWIAQDLDAYLALAGEKASDIAQLAALRAGLREQVRRSPLCDAPRFGRALGTALRGAWREWCKIG